MKEIAEESNIHNVPFSLTAMNVKSTFGYLAASKPYPFLATYFNQLWELSLLFSNDESFKCRPKRMRIIILYDFSNQLDARSSQLVDVNEQNSRRFFIAIVNSFFIVKVKK